MQSQQWFKDRQAAEELLRALGKVTPAALKTLQDAELARIIELLAEAMGRCGQERRERPVTPRRKRRPA
jgi:hypothetical protein